MPEIPHSKLVLAHGKRSENLHRKEGVRRGYAKLRAKSLAK
jgi:hypothetical protein